MIKSPKWLQEKIARHGERILKRERTEEEVATEIARQVLATDEQFALSIVTDYVRRKLKTWLATHRRVAVEGEPDDQLDLFPDIPRNLEVAPGRFVAQAFMTRRDWTAAIRQAETKASNASGHAEAIKRVADKVLPLLTDDGLTTADVWKHGPDGLAIGGGAR